MPDRLSRRSFLAGAGAALVASHPLMGQDGVPRMLDHILLGTNGLDAGIAFVEQHSGVRPAFGGVHPGRGTRNALASLGEKCYLEVIAPDPQQAGVPDTFGLQGLTVPRIVTWAVHVASASEQARRLSAAGIAFDGPAPGSRNRPDGRALHWQTLLLKDDRHGLLPFFIEWGEGSVHPSVDAPKGCNLVLFEVLGPDPSELKKTFAALGIEVSLAKADRPQLRATLTGARGKFVLSS